MIHFKNLLILRMPMKCQRKLLMKKEEKILFGISTGISLLLVKIKFLLIKFSLYLRLISKLKVLRISKTGSSYFLRKSYKADINLNLLNAALN